MKKEKIILILKTVIICLFALGAIAIITLFVTQIIQGSLRLTDESTSCATVKNSQNTSTFKTSIELGIIIVSTFLIWQVYKIVKD